MDKSSILSNIPLSWIAKEIPPVELIASNVSTENDTSLYTSSFNKFHDSP